VNELDRRLSLDAVLAGRARSILPNRAKISGKRVIFDPIRSLNQLSRTERRHRYARRFMQKHPK